MKRFYDLKIFEPFVMMEEYELVQGAIENMVRQVLLKKVTPEQHAMLEVVNYHYWDPNRPDEGKMQGLLEHLIFDALHATSFRTQGHFYAELFLYDLKKYTGISDLELFKKEIESINTQWKGIASIQILSVTSGSPTISFKLI